MCVGVVSPCPIKALARLPRAPWEKKALAGPPKPGQYSNEERYGKVQGVADEKGAMAVVECLGISQEDTMEGPPVDGGLGQEPGIA